MFAVSNDPVLLLHGQPGAAADWEPLRAAMGDAVRTIAIDRQGWDRRSAVTDLDGNARAALDALDRAGIQRATVVGPALERRLASIAAPTAIVAGSGDHVVPIAAARRLARQIPGAELVMVEHAGHLLHVQRAARLAEVILAA